MKNTTSQIDISNLSPYDRLRHNIAIGNTIELEDLPNLPKPPTYDKVVMGIAMILMRRHGETQKNDIVHQGVNGCPR